MGCIGGSRLGAGIVLLLACPVPCASQIRSLMSTEHSTAKATVMILDHGATVRVESPGGVREIALGSDLKKVSNVRFSQNGSRLAIVAQAGGPQLSIVDVQGARVVATYPIASAAVSPDGRAVVVEHQRENQSQDKPRFSLIPLNAPDGPPPPEPAMFELHADVGIHSRHSEFQWTDPEVVAFIGVAGTEARVFAFQVDQAGRIQKRGGKALALGDFVDTASLKPGVSPLTALAGAEITRVPSAGLTLRLQFPPNPSLRRRTTDVLVW